MTTPGEHITKQLRNLLIIFITALVVSGITAFPIESELKIAHLWLSADHNDFTRWIDRVYHGVHDTSVRYPFIAYGTDWLAFAHLLFAILFIGPLRDPVKNVWVIQFGLLACIAIAPLACIAGYARGIPLFWRCIDCSFGVVGGIIMIVCLRKIKQLQRNVAHHPKDTFERQSY